MRASALSYGRKISERLRVKRESLTGVEVHIGFACTSSVRESLSSENVYGSLRSDARHCGSLTFNERLNSARNSVFSMRTTIHWVLCE